MIGASIYFVQSTTEQVNVISFVIWFQCQFLVDIFINISSGTPEFSAAGMFASMLPLSAKAFRVDTTSTLTAVEMSGIIERINDTILISEPEMVTGLKNDAPDEEMIVFLNIVDDLLQMLQTFLAPGTGFVGTVSPPHRDSVQAHRFRLEVLLGR